MSPDTSSWVLHDIRRTVASGMARLGVNIAVVEKLLNHVSGSFAGIVGVYQRHSFSDEKRAAMTAWARHVAMLVSGDEMGKVVELAMARGCDAMVTKRKPGAVIERPKKATVPKLPNGTTGRPAKPIETDPKRYLYVEIQALISYHKARGTRASANRIAETVIAGHYGTPVYD